MVWARALRNSATNTGWVGPSAGGADGFAGDEFCRAAGAGDGEDVGLVFGGGGLFFGFGGGLQGFGDGLVHEAFEDDEVLEVFGDGPAVGALVEVPLLGGEAVDEGQDEGFAGLELIDDELAFVGLHHSSLLVVRFGGLMLWREE